MRKLEIFALGLLSTMEVGGEVGTQVFAISFYDSQRRNIKERRRTEENRANKRMQRYCIDSTGARYGN